MNIKKNILIYLLLTFFISCIFYVLLIKAGNMNAASNRYVFALMWSPGFAALLACRILNKPISSLGWRWGQTKYQIQSYLIPLVYAAIVYLIIWLLGLGGFPDNTFIKATADTFGWRNYSVFEVVVWQFLLTAVYSVLKGCANTFGEELGWRGYLTPEFFKITSYTKTSLIIGCIWSLWHYPVLIFANYNTGGNLLFSLTCFTVMTISLNFVYTWYRLKSKSLWTGVIIHSSHDIFIQNFFTPLTTNTGNTKFWYDEFGILLPCISLAIAIYFWTKRNELNEANKNCA